MGETYSGTRGIGRKLTGLVVNAVHYFSFLPDADLASFLKIQAGQGWPRFFILNVVIIKLAY
ncbi:hypothetical protein [Paenibacillus nasutitermitis]|uniref:Uncharacterized protein n=1 Tax=Paenibacillus nasutitermitis TaxID=1652958 RepID=A0A917DZ57_9BACL|nr:hypothetical protein [Paenibacillus nasutitermitis]GGD86379.1 hypothetical protein GCM10010911_51050 [Paenibacillus nasutitermitis]